MGVQGYGALTIYYFKNACDTVKREMLYSPLIECGIPMKLIRLIRKSL
jgi:hypothetical protein